MLKILKLLAPVCVHTENLFYSRITAEEYFTRKSMVDVRELKENHPEFALLLETSGDKSTRFSNLSHTKVPVNDLKVGSHILVRAGEVWCLSIYKVHSLYLQILFHCIMSSWLIVILMFLSLFCWIFS